MKVIGLVGSPRQNSNTEAMVEQILNRASQSGVETKIYNLSKMDIAPCKACQYCKSNEGKCATDDDMQILYKELKEADAFVLGSPVYMWQMTSQAKLFTDRLYAFYLADFEKKYGKKDIVLAFTQGNPDENMFAQYFKYTADMFEFLGYNVVDSILSTENALPAEVKEKKEVMDKALEIGSKLALN
ncbi:flavodoxin family protein [Methanobacterium alcaliphilum]|uniref:flavodoxin family protein n=1 Tax=Methanobacterium alcaliphilum TaxID=392018 RepID=UPI00200A3D20|nr:flavodoxin family protein [Methanobacterium alcaliphilum]MCK9150688.1 flavodoxin family protein [Methanobacterium alcaliphilum]